MPESPLGEADSPTDQSDKNVCPECGDSFDSERGLKSHMGLVHPGYLDKTVSCAVCGESKDIPQSQYEQSDRFFRGSKCRGKWVSENNTEESNPSYNGGKEVVDCLNCGDTFKVTPAKKQYRKHCSNACYAERMSEVYTGEKAPNYQGGRVELECEICNSAFLVKKAREEAARFCSYDCMAKEYEESMSGENSPVFSGGHDPYYGPNWPRQKRKARKRDQHRCQECGDTSKDLGQEVDVHHKTKMDYFKENYEAPEWWEKGNDLDNLICYCRSCHMTIEPRHELAE